MEQILRLNSYLRNRFGTKVYKLSLNGGMSCPNRDGTLDSRGCIFCSAGGSGEFTPDCTLPIKIQIAEAKRRVAAKTGSNAKYIAYFQAFTNTYAPIDYLRNIYYQAIEDPDVAALSIGTRPDCISEDTLALLAELNSIKPVIVELGLQSIHEQTAVFIRRGYPQKVFDTCVNRLRDISIEIVVHLILGLPGETPEDMLDSVDYISAMPIQGVKFQLLHVLSGTDLADYYRNTGFHILSLDEYCHILGDCIEHLRPDIVIHRLTGDGPKQLLIEPKWSANKKYVLNTINHYLSSHQITQGRKYTAHGT